MAVTLLKNQMTLAEAAKRLDAQGNIAEIIEILNEENPFLTDAHIEEANDGTTHLYTKRKSLPTVGHRRVNEGAIKSQSDTEQLREQTTLFEVWTEIDEEILSQQGAQKDRFLNTEAVAKIEALAQNGAEQVVYGNPANDPQDITGFIPRYNSLALPNVYGIGGTGSDLASLLLVEWDPKKVYFIYPKGWTKGQSEKGKMLLGVKEKKHGYETKEDASGNPYRVFRHQFIQKLGLVIADDDCVQRICNVEVDDASLLSGTNTILDGNKLRYLMKARNQLPKGGKNAVLYMNRDLKTQFDVWADNNTNGCKTYYDTQHQLPITFWRGIPIRLADALVSTETAVS